MCESHVNTCWTCDRSFPLLTLVRMISWGKLLMALVSQPSRLLAKLRMAWVRVPEERNHHHSIFAGHKALYINVCECNRYKCFYMYMCVYSKYDDWGVFGAHSLSIHHKSFHWRDGSTDWGQGAARQGWGSLPGPGTGCGHSSSSIVALVRIYTEPPASPRGSRRPCHHR